MEINRYNLLHIPISSHCKLTLQNGAFVDGKDQIYLSSKTAEAGWTLRVLSIERLVLTKDITNSSSEFYSNIPMPPSLLHSKWSPCGRYLALTTPSLVLVYEEAPDSPLMWQQREKIVFTAAGEGPLLFDWFVPLPKSSYTLDTNSIDIRDTPNQAGPSLLYGDYAFFVLFQKKLEAWYFDSEGLLVSMSCDLPASGSEKIKKATSICKSVEDQVRLALVFEGTIQVVDVALDLLTRELSVGTSWTIGLDIPSPHLTLFADEAHLYLACHDPHYLSVVSFNKDINSWLFSTRVELGAMIT
ncbi:hypothetical protein HDU91_004071, partial [Kappamyces sp. JEL0680]